MTVFDRDLKEITAIINSLYGNSISSENCALNNLTVITKEPFLDERALAYTEAVEKNSSFREALSKIPCKGICSDCNDCCIKKYCNSFILKKRKDSEKSLQMVDLFCGAGGLSLGFSQEGFTTALANDIEPCCVDTYAHNHPETPRDHIVLGDIRKVTDHLEGLIKDKSIDIVVGGPPCQGFSMANRQRLIDDPRNHLYKSYVDIVNRIKPKFFVMENVKGMLSVADQVKEDFRNIGYSVECHVLNAKDFGVPQNRERLIYIGNRLHIDNEQIFNEIFNQSENIKKHVLADAIYGLRPLQASRLKNSTESGSDTSGYIIESDNVKESNEYIKLINQGNQYPLVFNHKARYNNDRDIEIYGRMYQGDKSDDPKIADIMPYKRRNGIFKDKYFKLEENKVSKTITAHMKFDCNMYIHPTQARGLTPREAARIQSYPDDYFFRGPYTKTYMQIGNSVPPLLGRALAKVIKKYI
ncbi:DNA cytosine methyltransferase [Succinivibrio dextrinosolvens]|uniref:DNA cytosine methyltransferase n=1 Tax=Succinivibrio dextrinosolvens TaxID=83771 RepID=UPI00241C67E0|nr:DNA cytosine methyltransferase [Succinivibrio dextrinosolvens]MBE6422834.1 DNA cytosine methyltransferase [Succinivibrio dextrinosolvens]